MRIGVDARPLCGEKTGIGHYLEQIIEVLNNYDQKNEYFLFSPHDFELKSDLKVNFNKKIYHGRPGSLWMQYMVPYLLWKYKIDLFWGPNYSIPLIMPERTKSIITIHDMVSFVLPETLPNKTVFHNRYGLPLYVRRTKRIITESESTKRDIIKYLGYPHEKIDITVLGVNKGFFEKSIIKDTILKKHQLNRFPYILCVGTVEPRKNLTNVIKAFAQFQEEESFQHRLVIVGAKGWKSSPIFNLLESIDGIKEKVHFLGYVPDEDLPSIYQGADLFVYPSLYEGFGLPPLEAMASGLPVITSNISSMPEVVGNAGIVINPHSYEEIGHAMKRVLLDSNLANTLSSSALTRARQFSWENTALQTLKIFEQVANEG